MTNPRQTVFTGPNTSAPQQPVPGTFRRIALTVMDLETPESARDEALRLMQEAYRGSGVLAYQLAESTDTRKGFVLIEDTTFESGESVEAFKNTGAYVTLVDSVSRAERIVAEYVLPSRTSEIVFTGPNTVTPQPPDTDTVFRHVILFRMHEGAAVAVRDKALRLMRAMCEVDGVLAYQIAESQADDDRVILVEDMTFASRGDFEVFKQTENHTAYANFIRDHADWKIADYEVPAHLVSLPNPDAASTAPSRLTQA